jgi:hypothetical protein
MLIETVDRKLFLWNLEDIEYPKVDTVIETSEGGIKLFYQNSLLQRVFFNYENQSYLQDIYLVDSRKKFKKIASNINYVGDLHTFNKKIDTLLSLYNGYLFLYKYISNSIAVFDSIRICDPGYGDIAGLDSLLFIANANMLHCIVTAP